MKYFSSLAKPCSFDWPKQNILISNTCIKVKKYIYSFFAFYRVKDIADLIPQANPDGSGHIMKPEFRSVLEKMGMNMDDMEFQKLWKQSVLIWKFLHISTK